MSLHLNVLLAAQEHKGNTLRLPFPHDSDGNHNSDTAGWGGGGRRNLEQADTECGLVLTVLLSKVPLC